MVKLSHDYDYRAVHSVTKFQSEPPCLEEDLHQFVAAKYFSDLYLSRAYYLIK